MSTLKKTQREGRIRGPKLRVLAESSNGAYFRRALALADEGNLVLASNKRIGKALVETDEWKSMEKAFPCWTGTMTAYAKPGERLGTTIEKTDPYDDQVYVFLVPEEYRGEINVVLVAEHPNYTIIQDGNNFVVEASKVDCITQFPRSDGWYHVDEEHGIPFGREIYPSGANPCEDGALRSELKSRRLWRTDSSVTSILRTAASEVGRHFIGLGPETEFSSRLGVLVEAP